MKKLIRLAIIAVLALIPGTAALASDVSDALYSGTIRVSNNSTAATAVSTNMTLSTAGMITADYLNSSANNCAIQNTAGSDIIFMPAPPAGDTWAMFVPSIAASTYVNYVFYSGNVTGGNIKYFSGTGGLNCGDPADLEPSDNFTVYVNGYFDASTSDNIASKGTDFRLYNNSGNVTFDMPVTVEQTATSSVIPLYAALYTMAGQRIDNFPACTVTSVSFYLSKNGAPAGNASVTMRKTDNTLIGTFGTIDVTTLGAGAWFDFTNPVTNTALQDIRLLVEYSGGDAGNYPAVAWKNNDTIDGDLTYYDPAVWTDSAGVDCTIKYETMLTIEAPLSSGEHEIAVTHSGAAVTLLLDGIDSDNATTTSAVTANSDNWTFFGTGGAMPYATSANITVGGNLMGAWEWEYAATFTDQSGNGNDATPTFRGESSDADVYAELLSFGPVTEADAPAYTLSDPPDFITTTPGMTGNFSVNASYSYIGSDVITAICIASAVPEKLPVSLMAMLGILIVSLVYSYFARTMGHGSLFIKGIIIFVSMCIMAAFGIFDVWQLYFFAIIAVGLMWLSRQREAY